MSGADVLAALRTGAVLTSGWKARTFQNARYKYWLKYPDGAQAQVQASAVNLLLSKRQIRVKHNRSGGYREYEVTE